MSNVFIEKLFSGKWIAGPRIKDAIYESININRFHITPILNYLGEEYKNKKDIIHTTDKYIDLIREISRYQINANISLKPTQLGLRISYKYVEANCIKIIKYASKSGIFVWIDMENSSTIDNTLKLYSKLLRYGGVGICIQAYLKRSINDVKALKLHLKHPVIRLVKGAYTSTDKNVLREKEEVTNSYYTIMNYLFKNFNKFMIATHDDSIIKKALHLNKKYNKDITFAMLRGVRNTYLIKLSELGYKTSLYVPFGEEWISYSYRRLKETGHISLLLRSFFNSNSGI